MNPRLLLADHRYRIRAFVPQDAAVQLAAVRASLRELAAWLSWCRGTYDQADAERFLARCQSAWARGSAYDFGVFDAVGGRLLGAVALDDIRRDCRCANLSYWTRSDCTGRGIATLAARVVAHYGFRTLGLGRLEILTQPDNLASQRVAEKLGCQREGIARRRIVFRGEARDAVVHSLIPADLDEPSRDLPPGLPVRPADAAAAPAPSWKG